MPRRKRAGSKPTETAVDATVHTEAKRTNIPTTELGGFVAPQEQAPKTVVHPRDPSLDPQLVWRGKDEQDAQALEVPAVPIYIQEKVAPRVIIENLRVQRQPDTEQPDLFADFNGIAFEDLVDFYHHKQNWSNRMILGDSLLVMTSLAEKEGLKGQVQCVYIDPPYGIRFGSNWQVSTRKRDVKDGKDDDLTRQPEQIRAFRDTWELGIHSYLSYLRDRLVVARDLLSSTGSVFVQIGDENVHLVRSVLDEVFGSDNWCSIVSFAKTSAQTDDLLPNVADFILWYAKDIRHVKYRQLYLAKSVGGAGSNEYRRVQLSDGSLRPATSAELSGEPLPSGERLCRIDNLTSPRVREARTGYYPIEIDGKTYLPQAGEWKTHSAGIERLRLTGRLFARSGSVGYVRMIEDFPVFTLNASWTDTGVAGRPGDKVYAVQTSPKVTERCILMTTDPGDLVLDPTCGSGTTCYVAEQWGRRWITVDTSRVALTLARTRLMSARFPYYVLADTTQGARIAAERRGEAPSSALPKTEGDISRGFVYRTVPHVTLKSIANNPDIVEGMTREEIDAAIARHAESETLYDQPYDDRSVVRVTGPFTVESLAPHRVVAPDPEEGFQPPARDEVENDGKFRRHIVDNLRVAGVENTIRQERLVFSALEEWPGIYVQAAGEYQESGATRRAAISIGPEHGTVDAQFVREAAKEAVQNAFDVLVVCGYAFDAQVDTISRMGRLTILRTAINPDLQFGGDLLKKSGTANLFTVFGEPDIEVRDTPEGLVVEVRGVDVYDPTTGEIRSNATDDIACWFIDTEYNAESFFIRHAYFTGSGDPYAQLKRALRSDLDR